ncbi:hypothetical protein GF314_01835 [bacterium]|nr:hypothetical protein [bacterium]
MRKSYSKPELRAESLEVGVYGSYGQDDDGCGGVWSPFIGFFNPLFTLCCGG